MDLNPTPLPGNWFFLDTNIPDHFGHAVTEQLSHVWGWHEAKQRIPDLKALVFVPPSGEVPPWAMELWDAAGVARSDVRVLHRPVRAERLIACSPMLRIKQYVDPYMGEIWRTAGDNLSLQPTRDKWPTCIFHTRRRGNRKCNNRREVEAFFEERGFLVLAPEEHSLQDQVQLARHAHIIAGFAGSGMYQIAFTGEPKHVIAIATETYPAHNEHFMTAVLGHTLDLIVCKPDVPRERPGTFSAEAYSSSFTFDVRRDGSAVDQLLAEIK